MYEWAQLERPETLTDIQLAARFYYLQKLAFGGKVHGQSFGTVATGSGPRLNLLRIEEELSAVHLRLANVIIEHGPWLEVVERYDRPGTLHYLDPPYWETEGYGMDFDWGQYEAIAAFMARAQGKVVLSINDHPAIRELFGRFTLVPLQIRYTIGREGRDSQAGELIIKSWDDAQAQLL
jgi:DNA adenine methylase